MIESQSELVERGAATPSYLYECLGREEASREEARTKPRKKDTEQSIPVAESIDTEQSSTLL